MDLPRLWVWVFYQAWISGHWSGPRPKSIFFPGAQKWRWKLPCVEQSIRVSQECLSVLPVLSCFKRRKNTNRFTSSDSVETRKDHESTGSKTPWTSRHLCCCVAVATSLSPFTGSHLASSSCCCFPFPPAISFMHPKKKHTCGLGCSKVHEKEKPGDRVPWLILVCNGMQTVANFAHASHFDEKTRVVWNLFFTCRGQRDTCFCTDAWSKERLLAACTKEHILWQKNPSFVCGSMYGIVPCPLRQVNVFLCSVAYSDKGLPHRSILPFPKWNKICALSETMYVWQIFACFPTQGLEVRWPILEPIPRTELAWALAIIITFLAKFYVCPWVSSSGLLTKSMNPRRGLWTATVHHTAASEQLHARTDGWLSALNTGKLPVNSTSWNTRHKPGKWGLSNTECLFIPIKNFTMCFLVFYWCEKREYIWHVL